VAGSGRSGRKALEFNRVGPVGRAADRRIVQMMAHWADLKAGTFNAGKAGL